MRGGYFGGGYFLRLSSREFYDILECVEAYCKDDAPPKAALSPEIREFYPENTKTNLLINERFWKLHAALANRKG